MQLPPSGRLEDDRVPSGDLTVRQLWDIIVRRRALIVRSTLAAAVIAATVGVCTTKKYEAKGEIQIQKDASGSLGLDSMMGGGGAAASDALEANVTLQTEAKILESQTLALTVIDRLHLSGEPDFATHFSPIGWALGLISPAGPADGVGRPLGDSPKKRDHLLGVFRKSTKVAPVAGTRLIDVSYVSSDPKLAASVVNQMIAGLTDYDFQTRFNATSQTSKWLGQQLSELRSSSDDLQAQVADLQKSSEIFTFGGQDLTGKGPVYSTVLDQLQQTTATLTQAQSNRIVRGAIAQAARAGNPEAVAALVNSGIGGASSTSIGTALALLQSLRAQESTQKAQVSEMASKFGPTYPRLEELQANLGSLQRSVADEQSRLTAQAQSDYAVAQQVEERTRGVFAEQKKTAETLNDKAIQYQLLRQEADQSRDLYSRLQSRLKEAGVLEGLHSSNITVVEPGRVPSRPSSPNIMLLLAAVLVGGPFVGLGLIFTREILDGTIHVPGELTARFGSVVLGELPQLPAKFSEMDFASPAAPSSKLVTLAQPNAAWCEALRSVRTALLQNGPGVPPQVLLITSAAPHEGKTTVAANLAVQLAKQNKRVLLVDTDLRRGRLHLTGGATEEPGLSDLLRGAREDDLTAAVEGVAGLFFLPAGPVPTDPSEILGSGSLQRLLKHWRETFDFIVLDAGPSLCITDAVVVAPYVDLTLLIARFGVTRSAELDQAYRLLQTRAPKTAIGIVVNGTRTVPTGYSGKERSRRSSAPLKGQPSYV